ncbi:hypothetical protein GJ744_008347 [Endocarpon pusillum]|uniref:Microtubule associated protein n=1 Tax=Endocarpon pusillum TaxID=364733 RepID=A0A8H7AQ37_9EURO|nr:hypothetical protein GJ744_008347 [Endocarpon pusillum]
MVVSSQSSPNVFVRYTRKVYHGLGFSRGYNFVLFIIFGGAFLGFTLARLQYLNFNGVFCKQGGAAPGECYWYTQFPKYKVGILLHLSTILPAAFLAIYQFIPVIRHKCLSFHRINGWTIVVLVLIANAGAIIIAPRTFGGDLSVQTAIGTLVLMTTIGLALAIYNAKRLQIDQHRAWMLRTWFYLGSILTLRIIMISGAAIISSLGRYHFPMECAKLDYMMEDGNSVLAAYPDCISYYNNTDPSKLALVQADLNGSIAEFAAGLNITFGMAMWLALLIHAVGVETYLQLTPRESQRLRQISYERQLEAGFKHPGSAGLTADRLGDAHAWQATKS